MSPGLITISDYIPKREALLVQVDLSDYLIDYYLHRKEHAPGTSAEHDEKLKDLLACFAIYLSGRTARETHAWTVHLVADEPYSLFVTGNTGELDESGVAKGFLVGNVLTEHIRHTDVNSIHAQFTQRGKTHTSMVQCDTNNIPRMVEQFYERSEQHPGRLQLSQTSDTAIGLIALPEYDDEWVRSVSFDALLNSAEIERSRMRTCNFAFQCDCSAEKLLPYFRGLTRDALNELYGEDSELLITCPRCSRQFSLERARFNEDN
jgi:molecular chaperone Hsp33